MKNVVFLFLIGFLLLNCKESGQNQKSEKDSVSNTVNTSISKVTQTTGEEFVNGFYVINVTATANASEAAKLASNLIDEGYPAGYLWIKDFESLSGKELYSVFIGPFEEVELCLSQLLKYKAKDPNAYAVKVYHEKDRIVIYNKNDFRVNNEKIALVLKYLNYNYKTEFYEKIIDWGYVFPGAFDFYKTESGNWLFIGDFNTDDYTQNEMRKLGLSDLKYEKYGCVLIKNDKARFFDLSTGIGSLYDEIEKFLNVKLSY